MQIDPGQYHRQSISDHAMAKWKEKHNGGIFEEGPAQAPPLPSLAPFTVGLRPRSLVPSPPATQLRRACPHLSHRVRQYAAARPGTEAAACTPGCARRACQWSCKRTSQEVAVLKPKEDTREYLAVILAHNLTVRPRASSSLARVEEGLTRALTASAPTLACLTVTLAQ